MSFFCSDTLDVVKQSAALCLLRLFRTDPSIIPSGEWTSRIIHLLNDQHMGVVTAASSLIEALVKRSPDEYKGCVSLAVSRLSRIVTSSYTDFQVCGFRLQGTVLSPRRNGLKPILPLCRTILTTSCRPLGSR